MSEPFDLLDGMRWAPLNDADRKWLAAARGAGLPASDGAHHCVEFTIRIRRNADGLERDCPVRWSPFVPETLAELLDWIGGMYGSGNYGCDCNRALFFARAADEDEVDVECGHGRYSIVAPTWLVELAH
jgi:hypothetical protein